MHIDRYRNTITIENESDAEQLDRSFATLEDFKRWFSCKKSLAYAEMAKYRRYKVHDRRFYPVRTYSVVEWRFIDTQSHPPRGNPRFRDRAYQRELSRRPRKQREKVDN